MIRLSLIVLTCLSLNAAAAPSPPQLKDGDIIFHASQSAQSLAIQRATNSKYSHMGLIVHRNGKPFVFEAISTVQSTPLNKWIKRGEASHFVVKRLKNADTVLTPQALKKLHNEAKRFTGRPYDLTFGWADDRIYCSELVWKAYDRALGIQIGKLARVRDFNLTDPAVQIKMKERYGNNTPLDEPVISPAAMFDSALLVTVAQK